MPFNPNRLGCEKEEKSQKKIEKKFGIKSEILELLKNSFPDELNKEEILGFLSNKGVKCGNGTFYNAVSELKKQNLIVSRRYFGVCYQWNKSKNEYNPSGVESNIVKEAGFVNTVLELAKANGFESVCRVHDIHLVTNFWRPEEFLNRLNKSKDVWRHERCYSWKRNNWAKSWVIKLFVGHYHRVSFQFFECGRLACTIKCIKKAIPANLTGLRNLERIIIEACLVVFDESKFWCFPQPDKWVVCLWHYGRDSKHPFNCKFDVTFETFFRGLARIYVREADGRLRLEEIQSPRKSLGLLKDEAKDLFSEKD